MTQPLAGRDMAPPHNPKTKSQLIAGILGITMGGLGVHRFYLGYTEIGIAQIAVTFFTCGLGGLWGVIEGIMILSDNHITTDASGLPLRDD